ncbi:unnamed protein product [Rotaria sp. Silwood2]|nr:unnamed protein product [Rotaria sp. Silwood2]
MGQAPPKASAGSQCSICNKGTVVYNCGGCSKDFCYNHLEEHRQTLRQQCSDIKKDCDKFHRQLVEQKKESRKPPFIREVNLWEQESIQKISQTAEECRQILTKQHMRHFTEMEDRLSQLTEELKKIQQENEFNEINIDRIKTQLTKLTGELSELPNVRIQKENTLFIEKFSVVVSPETHQEKKLYQTNLNKNQVKLTEDFNQSPNTSAPIDSDSVSFEHDTSSKADQTHQEFSNLRDEPDGVDNESQVTLSSNVENHGIELLSSNNDDTASISVRFRDPTNQHANDDNKDTRASDRVFRNDVESKTTENNDSYGSITSSTVLNSTISTGINTSYRMPQGKQKNRYDLPRKMNRLLQMVKSLEELQICSNDYTKISSDYGFQHESLKRLYISNNNITEWQSICRLGRLFSRLETLIASDNPLESFRSDEDVNICFSHLHTLSVDKVEISEWDDIVALTKLPRLNAVRIQLTPLLKPYQKDERFFLLLGYMKNITKLNGSVITANERETSERRFIRYYSQRDDKPQRYYELTEKHGNLKPLVDIKIRAPYLINVRLVYNQITHDKEIDVRQTVQQFKKYLHETFKIPLTRLRVFYVDDVAFNMGVCGPEELKYPQRLLHTYNIHDGDQFHIDLKPDPPKPQYSNRTVDTTRHNKKSTDSNSTNSSTSSDDDKTNLSVEISPFSLDSLQKLAEEETINNNNINQTSIELDNLYPSTDKNVQIKMNDEDDDLLLAAAAAAACNNVKTK